jgi:hypothetical protein
MTSTKKAMCRLRPVLRAVRTALAIRFQRKLAPLIHHPRLNRCVHAFDIIAQVRGLMSRDSQDNSYDKSGQEQATRVSSVGMVSSFYQPEYKDSQTPCSRRLAHSKGPRTDPLRSTDQ